MAKTFWQQKLEEEEALKKAISDAANVSKEQGFAGTSPVIRNSIKKNAGPLLPQVDPLKEVVEMPKEEPVSYTTPNSNYTPPSTDGQQASKDMLKLVDNTKQSLEQQKQERAKILEMIQESAAKKSEDQGVANLLRAKARILSTRKNVPSSEDVAKSIENTQDTSIDAYKESLKANSPTSILDLAKLESGAYREGGVGARADRNADRADKQFSYKQMKDVQEALNKDKAAQQAVVENAGIDKVLSIADKDIRAVDGIMLSNAAKALGRDSGNIAVQESERILNRTFAGDITNLFNYLESEDASVMTPQQKANLISLFRTVRDKNLQILEERTNYHAYQGSQRTGSTQEAVKQTIMPEKPQSQPAAKTPAVSNQPETFTNSKGKFKLNPATGKYQKVQ